jgi:hypothetical protein
MSRAFLFVLTILLALPSLAQEAPDLRAPGRMNAQTFREVPPDATMRVRPFDDTRDNRRLKQQIQRTLERKGRQIDDRAGALSMNFETAVQQIGRAGPPPGIGSLQADRDDARVRLNLYSSTEDSLVNPRRSEGGGSGSVQFQLTLSLDDARGVRLWQGTATLLGSPTDEQAAYGAMARVLLEEIGRTVRQKPFRIE